jgi:hypothetical protein
MFKLLNKSIKPTRQKVFNYQAPSATTNLRKYQLSHTSTILPLTISLDFSYQTHQNRSHPWAKVSINNEKVIKNPFL